jgi:hypothetical protein
VTLPPFVAIAMAELRRHCCRVNHGLKDIARCPRCVALAGWDAWRAIVQEAVGPGVPLATPEATPVADHRHTDEQRRMVAWYTKRMAQDSRTCGWGLNKAGDRFVAEYAQLAWEAWQAAQQAASNEQKGGEDE